jgi:molybdenum cofactor cytidylyltransferase
MIWGIILAAGESRRMHEPKMLLRFGDVTILEAVIKSCEESCLDRIMVVVGAYKKRVEERIDRYSVKICVNDNYKEGMLSSVQKGFQCLPKGTRAAVIVLGDQPLIPSAVIDKVVKAFTRTGKGMVLPVYKHQRGHPLLIDSKYQGDIKNLDPEIGLRELLQKFSLDIEEVIVNDPNVLKDIDTPEDYERSY